MAMKMESTNASAAAADFRLSPTPSPLAQVPTHKALQREFWTSLAATRQRLASFVEPPPIVPPFLPSAPVLLAPKAASPASPAAIFEISGSTRFAALHAAGLEHEQANARVAESNDTSGSKREDDDPISAVTSSSLTDQGEETKVCEKKKRRKKREEEELMVECASPEEEQHRTLDRRIEAIKRETNATTTSLDVENKAVFAFWGRLIQRFGGSNGGAGPGGQEKKTDGSTSPACPEAVLLDIMEIISFYASHEITMQDAFTKLATVFRLNKCIDLYEDLVNLLLQQDICKTFLIKKGVDLAFLNKKERGKEDSEQEELASDYEKDSKDDNTEEEEDSEEPPPKRSRRKRQSTRKRKVERSEETASATSKRTKASNKARSDRAGSKGETMDEAGRLRRSPDKWTQEEDDKLIELVEKHGTGTKKWRQIAEELGTTKNSSKCAQHWRRVLAPNIHKGSWSAEEEAKLLRGVEKYGLTQWTLVARDIPGRTDIQCRYHYMRQQNSRACSWTLEEEESLKNLVAKHEAETPECWVLVSDELAESKIRRAPRTALECQQHWSLMQTRDSKKRA